MKRAVWFCQLLLIPALLMGQNNVTGSGTVIGRVTDATGAIVVQARITLTDTQTNTSLTTDSNSSGLYVFESLNPGVYDITASKSGFRQSVIARQTVRAAGSITIDFSLEVGALNETVQVQAAADAELQTLNSTMGITLSGDIIMNLPTLNRDVAGLVFLQPTAAPTFHNAEGNITSGQIAGNASDQNTYQVDGGNNTDDMDGDRGSYVGSRSGVLPTPPKFLQAGTLNASKEAVVNLRLGRG